LKIIVGLGNPGPKYFGTRHNFGFAVVDALAAKRRIGVTSSAYGAQVGRGRAAGEEVVLVKPRTFMNLSGDSVTAALKGTGEGPAGLIVIHDDLDLPLGRIRIKKSGGDGGHNGVASVIAGLDTDLFVRVRMGIGRPPEGEDPVEYVLKPFGADELEVVNEAVGRAVEAVMVIVRQGPDRAMNLFNRTVEQAP
jgi:PTH1 family peptidyl-tRNA hydrolase